MKASDSSTKNTDNEIVPDNVKTFSDIPLKEFHNMSKCKNNGAYTKVYTGTKKQKYFGPKINTLI